LNYGRRRRHRRLRLTRAMPRGGVGPGRVQLEHVLEVCLRPHTPDQDLKHCWLGEDHWSLPVRVQEHKKFVSAGQWLRVGGGTLASAQARTSYALGKEATTSEACHSVAVANPVRSLEAWLATICSNAVMLAK
jgi:hypothetical protein